MTQVLAIELYRENRVSRGRAAKLEAPMHYSAADLEEDLLTLERLSS